MASDRTRREFLGNVGQGMLVASVGFGTAFDMGLTKAWADEGGERLSFGPLGLHRPDAPANVPPADEAVRQTLTIGLDTFCDMIQPMQGQEKVELLPLGEAGAGKVMALAQKGDYAGAVEAMTHIKPASDDLSYVFDLAVLQEAAGQRQAALENYRKLSVHRTGNAQQVRRGIARLTHANP